MDSKLNRINDDAAGEAWMDGIAREWINELRDPHEDIYTLEDKEAASEF